MVGFELAQARLTIAQARIRTATAKERAVNDALTLPELTCMPARNPIERRKSQLCKAFRVGRIGHLVGCDEHVARIQDSHPQQDQPEPHRLSPTIIA